MTELQIHEGLERGGQAIQLLLDLEQNGALDEVSLTLTDTTMGYDTWESLGRFFGRVERSTNWWVGDWLIFGEAVFGEEHAQAVEATTKDRYDRMEQVTGLAHGTLMNVRAICAAVARPRRRGELGFWIHQEVYKLDPADQEFWLGVAIDRGLTRAELRQEIRDHFNPPSEDEGDGDPDPGPAETPLSIGERVEVAGRLVVNTASNNSEGDWIVPNTSMSQLIAALGME